MTALDEFFPLPVSDLDDAAVAVHAFALFESAVSVDEPAVIVVDV